VVEGEGSCAYLCCFIVRERPIDTDVVQLEEKKKLDQLRKEKEEERQMQELQRLQEEQTGRKRQEKLDWMYATPATGSTQNANDLEDYLLGKKRVDQILIGNENEKVRLILDSLSCTGQTLTQLLSALRLAPATKTSLPPNTPTPHGTQLRRSGTTRSSRSSSRNRPRTHHL
jgi:hypothetical protein